MLGMFLLVGSGLCLSAYMYRMFTRVYLYRPQRLDVALALGTVVLGLGAAILFKV